MHVSHSSLSAQAPGLAVVLVGSRKDSETYVRNKKKACEEVGIASFGETLSEDATEEEVLKVLILSPQFLPLHVVLLMQDTSIFYFRPHLLVLWQIC